MSPHSTTRAMFERTGPVLRLGVIGAVGHGATTLTSAVTTVLHDRHPDLDPAVAVGEFNGAFAQTAYRTGTRHYTHVDCVGDAGQVRNMISGAVRFDGAIVVVSATEGPTPGTREQVLLARQVGVPSVVVALTKADLADDELLQVVELEVRELLSAHGYPGDDLPVVPVSAPGALRGEPRWADRILALTDAVDAVVPQPPPASAGPFLTPVEDVFTVHRRGTIVTGRVDRGVIGAHADVEIVGLRPGVVRATVAGFEGICSRFREPDDLARPGENTGLLLRGVTREDVERGMVVVAPGSVGAYRDFEAVVEFLPEEQGGVPDPLPVDLRLSFHVRGADVTGLVDVVTDTGAGSGPRVATVRVGLDRPVALEPYVRFGLGPGGRSGGVGCVTSVGPPPGGRPGRPTAV